MPLLNLTGGQQIFKKILNVGRAAKGPENHLYNTMGAIYSPTANG